VRAVDVLPVLVGAVSRRRQVELRWKTRIGILPGWSTPTDTEQAALRAKVVTVLQGIPGCTVAEVTLPDGWEDLQAISSTTGEGSNWFVPYLRQDVQLFATRLTGFLGGTLRSASTYLKAMMARYELFQRTQAQLFTQCDLVLVPNVGEFDLIGHPLCSFPIGFGTDTTTGLTVPRGAVLGGAPFSEERILSVICAYQSLTDWHTRRPPDPTVATPAPPPPAAARGTTGLMAATEAALAAVPAWPGQAPDFVYTIDPAAQPPDES